MLTGQIALVTGASRGIGASVADHLGAEGAVVIGTATSESGAQKVSERFKQLGVAGTGMVLNVTDAAQIQECIDSITADWGAVSILVNNAGITRDNLLMRMKPDDWNAVLETNLSSVYYTCKLCLRPMVKARYGRIINIASIIGVTGNAGQSNYAAAKAGIIGFGKSLAREVGPRNITVNTIAPGFIISDMTDALPEQQREALLGEIALGRLGEPSDIANAVGYLASDKASYVTGQTLHINGGMYMS